MAKRIGRPMDSDSAVAHKETGIAECIRANTEYQRTIQNLKSELNCAKAMQEDNERRVIEEIIKNLSPSEITYYLKVNWYRLQRDKVYFL